MGAAISLRLREARRMGGIPITAAAAVAILLVSLFGGETVDGRYGLATDIAATLSYAAAILLGAFPFDLGELCTLSSRSNDFTHHAGNARASLLLLELLAQKRDLISCCIRFATKLFHIVDTILGIAVVLWGANVQYARRRVVMLRCRL